MPALVSNALVRALSQSAESTESTESVSCTKNCGETPKRLRCSAWPSIYETLCCCICKTTQLGWPLVRLLFGRVKKVAGEEG